MNFISIKKHEQEFTLNFFIFKDGTLDFLFPKQSLRWGVLTVLLKKGAMIPVWLPSRCRGSFCIVIYMTWWHLPSKTLRKIEIWMQLLHFSWEVLQKVLGWEVGRRELSGRISHVCKHVCTHVYTQACTHVHTRMSSHMSRHTSTPMSTPISAHMSTGMVHTCLCTCLHTCLHTCLYTCPHNGIINRRL